MGNLEIKCILENLQKRYDENKVLLNAIEHKLFSNIEMSINDRIHHTIEYVRHNTISYTLNEIIFAIKSDFETEKLFESKNTKEEENKIASPIRQALISQLEELVNHAQARALNDLEKGVLSPEEYNTNIPFHVWMHRLQGVVQVILNTPEYSDDTRAKIIDIMHKLQEIKCL